MKRYIPRTIVFSLAFVVSFYATVVFYVIASVFTPSDEFAMKCGNFCFLPRIKKVAGLNPKGEVEVHFRGFGTDSKNGWNILKFEVINNSPEAIYYYGYDRGINEMYRVMIDGKMSQPFGLCGTGLQKLHLHSGESVNFSLTAGRLGREEAARSTDLRVGYVYESESREESVIYWSSPIQLSDEIRAELLKPARP